MSNPINICDPDGRKLSAGASHFGELVLLYFLAYAYARAKDYQAAIGLAQIAVGFLL